MATILLLSRVLRRIISMYTKIYCITQSFNPYSFRPLNTRGSKNAGSQKKYRHGHTNTHTHTHGGASVRLLSCRVFWVLASGERSFKELRAMPTISSIRSSEGLVYSKNKSIK